MKTSEKSTVKSHRLFVASFASIENYSMLKEELNPFFDGTWVKQKNLHMTFKFLGDVVDVEPIITKLKKIHYPKKQIVIFQKLRVFHKNILSLRSSNKTLYRIQNQIDELLDGQFIKQNNFKPHITLMRIKKIKDDTFKKKFDTFKFTANLDLKVCLVESILKPEGVKYKIIREF